MKVTAVTKELNMIVYEENLKELTKNPSELSDYTRLQDTR